MRAVEKILNKLDSYLYSIKRDTIRGWYVLEVGIPVKWTHKSTSKISSEEVGNNEKMKMIKINPNEEYDGDVCIDELLDYANQIIVNNKKIEDMRASFEKKMEQIAEKLEEEYERFEEEIEEIEEGLYEEKNEKRTTKIKTKTTTPDVETEKK